ncbi:MAG: kanamycin nucleotidyltransferase C-terminal domain-containing protein [Armatimonadota bacterium]
MINQPGMGHHERIEIAGRLAEEILRAYGDAVHAVFVTSSTARGLDLPHSDLELTAVVRDGVEIEEKLYVYRGLLIEIEYPQESAIIKNTGRVTWRWPIVAGGYRDRIVLYEREGWLRRLDLVMDERDGSDFRHGLCHATTALIECRDKLRNARLVGDDLVARFNGFLIAEHAAVLVLFLNRRWMTTSRWLFSQASECPAQPPDFRRLVEILIGVVPSTLDAVADAGERLCADIVALAGSLGISVESDALVV